MCAAQVPNIRAAQLGLEVECVLSACLTYSSTLGWQSAGVLVPPSLLATAKVETLSSLLCYTGLY
jgi:hypothetical protein